MRSVRDSSANSKEWLKAQSGQQQSDTYGGVIHKLQRDLARLRRVRTGMPEIPAQILEFHPFKVYNCDVPIDAPVGTEKWQCWQVRTGIISVRSKYVIPSFVSGFLVNGNSEYLMTVTTGTDGGCSGIDATTGNPNEFYDFQNDSIVASDYFNSLSVLTPPQLVLVGNDPAGYTVTESGATCTFILPNELDAFNSILAAFWLEITDDPIAGIEGTIKCRLWSEDQPSPLGRTDAPFLNSAAVIPIARLDGRSSLILPANGKDLVATQLQYDHIVNRRIHGADFTPVVSWRGQTGEDDWDTDFGGQVFYPGDQVTVFYNPISFGSQLGNRTPVILWSHDGISITTTCPSRTSSADAGFTVMSRGFTS